jgi:hypothetical protein
MFLPISLLSFIKMGLAEAMSPNFVAMKILLRPKERIIFLRIG